MPELPEVETVRRGLQAAFVAAPAVVGISYSTKKLRVPIAKQAITRALKGVRFEDVRRRAKFLLLDTPNSTLISHLGMSGSWRFAPTGEAGLKHDHIRIEFDDGRSLIYHDPRRFGLFLLARRGEEEKSVWLRHLGVEPLSEKFTAGHMSAAVKKRSGAAVKNVLMDQKVVVGVGNIYAVEALFHAGVRPTRRAANVKRHEWEAICSSVRRVLEDAIEFGGTTLRDYRQASGELGEFQKELYVYDRAGRPCKTCAAPIVGKMIAGRSTYWCKQCQK